MPLLCPFSPPQAPDNVELATRSQLQLRAGQDTAHDFQPFTGGCAASAVHCMLGTSQRLAKGDTVARSASNQPGWPLTCYRLCFHLNLSDRPAGGAPSGDLSADDLAALGKYVNPSYLQVRWRVQLFLIVWEQ